MQGCAPDVHAETQGTNVLRLYKSMKYTVPSAAATVAAVVLRRVQQLYLNSRQLLRRNKSYGRRYFRIELLQFHTSQNPETLASGAPGHPLATGARQGPRRRRRRRHGARPALSVAS